MTTALIAALALAGVLACALVLVVGRQSRGAERREKQLLQLVKDERVQHREVLDRVMHAAGRPWEPAPVNAEPSAVRDTANLLQSAVVEDPMPGAFFPLDELDQDTFWPGAGGIVEGLLEHANGRSAEAI